MKRASQFDLGKTNRHDNHLSILFGYPGRIMTTTSLLLIGFAGIVCFTMGRLWYLVSYTDQLSAERRRALAVVAEQQARLQLAVAATRIGYWNWRTDEEAIDVDGTLAELLALGPGRLDNLSALLEALRPSDRPLVELTFEGARWSGLPIEVECRPCKQDPATRWILLRGYALPNQVQPPFHIHGVAIDITERKQTQEALRDQQERLTSMVESAMDAIITVDQNRRVVLFNSAAERMFGYSGAQVRGQLFDRFVPARSCTLGGSGEPTDAAMPDLTIGLRADATEFPMEASLSEVMVGGVRLRTIILRDITERVRSESAIREREARFRIMADSTPLLVWIADDRAAASYVNQRWMEVTGRSEREALDRGWLEAIHPDDRQALASALGNWGQRMTATTLEHRVRTRNATYRWTLLTIMPLVTEPGQRPQFMGSEVDITDRRQAEQTLRAFAQELERQVAERTAALSASHAQMRGLARDLIRSEQDERRRVATELHDYLAQLLVVARLKLTQIKRLMPHAPDQVLVHDTELILNDALAYTRSLVAELSPQILYHLGLAPALRWLGERMAQHHLQVRTITVNPDSIAIPEETALHLYQAARELLFNVLKHADCLEATVTLAVTEDRQAIVTVSDKGRGFNPARLQDKAAESWDRYGLFNVRERLQSVGGAMEIVSRPGAGTAVTLTCPLPDVDELPVVDRPRPEPARPGVTTSDPGQRIRILLTDDHAIVRQGLRALLSHHADLDVVGEAATGLEAVELAASLLPDVIVMDANMPQMDGIDATSHIKSLHPQIVVIGLSVQTSDEVTGRMLAAGASRYLTKESAGDQLYAAILAATGRDRADKGAVPPLVSPNDRSK